MVKFILGVTAFVAVMAFVAVSASVPAAMVVKASAAHTVQVEKTLGL